MNRRALWIGAALLGAVAVAAWLLWPAGEPDAPLAEDEPDDPSWERWVMLDDGEAAPPPGRGAAPEPPPAERWEARRAEWREHWRRSVEVVPLGPTPPTLDADSIREALAPGREALRACIEGAGGWRALRGQRPRGEPRGEGGTGERRGPRPRRSVSFDVRPDGTVDASSIEFEPPMPDALDACFRAYFAAPTLPGAGPDGARVELPMMGGRRGRPEGDGGVGWGRRRWRERGQGEGEERRPRERRER